MTQDSSHEQSIRNLAAAAHLEKPAFTRKPEIQALGGLTKKIEDGGARADINPFPDKNLPGAYHPTVEMTQEDLLATMPSADTKGQPMTASEALHLPRMYVNPKAPIETSETPAKAPNLLQRTLTFLKLRK